MNYNQPQYNYNQQPSYQQPNPIYYYQQPVRQPAQPRRNYTNNGYGYGRSTRPMRPSTTTSTTTTPAPPVYVYQDGRYSVGQTNPNGLTNGQNYNGYNQQPSQRGGRNYNGYDQNGYNQPTYYNNQNGYNGNGYNNGGYGPVQRPIGQRPLRPSSRRPTKTTTSTTTPPPTPARPSKRPSGGKRPRPGPRPSGPTGPHTEPPLFATQSPKEVTQPAPPTLETTLSTFRPAIRKALEHANKISKPKSKEDALQLRDELITAERLLRSNSLSDLQKLSRKLSAMIRRLRMKRLYFFDSMLQKSRAYTSKMSDEGSALADQVSGAVSQIDTAVMKKRQNWRFYYVLKEIRRTELLQSAMKFHKRTSPRVSYINEALDDLIAQYAI